MRNWYRKGAEVPEQLSRFLFLEQALPGRRVLYIGAAGSELEEAIVELGAKSVVCIADAHHAIARRDDSESESAVLPADPVWPGQAGAFDLIVDFGLAAAVERGERWRLQEIQRLLSEDGFALAAWDTGESPGLARFFSGPAAPAPEVSPETRLAYGEWVRLLLDQFELVEVYFQTLLLGYFFGSFELDTSDDGIAPHTGLMGSEPEPATHYLFAFGNAVPFLQDASLVQLPLMDVFENWSGARDVALPPASLEETRPAPSIASAPESAAADLHPDERNELLGRCAELEGEARARNQQIRRLDGEKNAALATLHELESELRRSVEMHAHAEQRTLLAQQEVETLRRMLGDAETKLAGLAWESEEDTSAQVRWQEERQRLRQRARLLEQRMQTLQSKLEHISKERDHAREEALLLGEELDARAEQSGPYEGSGQASEPITMASTPDGVRAAAGADFFEAELRDAEQRLDDDENAVDSSREKNLRSEKEAALARLAKGVNTLMQEREQQQQAWSAERARYEQTLLTERAQATQRQAEIVSLRSQVEQLQASVAERSQTSQSARDELASLRARAEKSEARLAELEPRLRTAQAALENRSRQMGVAQQAFHEAAAQRDTLQRVLETRDREAADLRDELATALAELDEMRHASQAAAIWGAPATTPEADARWPTTASEPEVEVAALRSQLELQQELLLEARREHDAVRSAYELTSSLLAEARFEYARVSSAYELAQALLDEARQDHGQLSAGSELMRSLLEEARASHERVQAEAELAEALLAEAREAHTNVGTRPGQGPQVMKEEPAAPETPGTPASVAAALPAIPNSGGSGPESAADAGPPPRAEPHTAQ